MSARVLAVANQKGGVGKTTTAVNLCASLAAMGRDALLLDIDAQGNASMASSWDSSKHPHTSADFLLDQVDSQSCVYKTRFGYDLIAGDQGLTVAEVRLLRHGQSQSCLKKALDSLGHNYHFVVIDCPPSLNILTINALVAAHGVLVPVQCEYYALEGLARLMNTIAELRRNAGCEAGIQGLLRTMYDGRNRLAQQVSEQLLEHFGDQVMQTVIPRNVRLAEAPSHGQPALHYDARSQGAAAYLALAAELCRHITQDSVLSEHLETTDAQ